MKLDTQHMHSQHVLLATRVHTTSQVSEMRSRMEAAVSDAERQRRAAAAATASNAAAEAAAAAAAEGAERAEARVAEVRGGGGGSTGLRCSWRHMCRAHGLT